MNDLKWQQIKGIFADAVQLPVQRREVFVRERCVEDEDLFREVISLLDASTEPENLIENNAIDLASNLGENTKSFIERHFGHYRIIREIGSGGMGTVFLAERDDGEFKMQVALKIVRQSIANNEIIENFKRERQILANLHHANIAALLDGGISEKGEPFLAMEYVDGVSLTEFASQQGISLKEKLRLFLKICSAVSYAHRNLIVHRDIKPSNILITADGEPKLLDFGLSKAFEADGAMTRTVLRAFTPAYAAPEQINGEKITTASDIYSLGVVFYELLTGTKPLDVENKSFDEIASTINNSHPVQPSSASAADHSEASRHMLRGDLDTITMTALRKEPERRFKTVDDFAEDIKRHLAGRPISARPNTMAYLAGKFIRRNKIAVAAAMIVLVALVTGLAVSLWQADQARKERDRAENRFQDIRQLSNSLIFEISPKIERLPGSLEARELLVKRGLEYLDRLAGESQKDPSLQAELAYAYEKIANLQGNLDRPNLSDFTGAIASFEKARMIRAQIPNNAENQFRLAENFRVASSIRNRQNDIKGAIEDAEQAKILYAGLTANNPDSTEFRIAAIEAKLDEGTIYSFNNQYSTAIPLFRESLEMLRGLDHNERMSRYLNARALTFLANALSWDGQQADAETEIAKALAITEKLDADFPTDSEVQANILMTYNIASGIFEGTKNNVAVDLAKRAFATADRAATADKADSQATFNLARAYSRLGISYLNLGNPILADENLQKAETILRQLIDNEPKNAVYQRDLAKLYGRMADTSESNRRYNDALVKYQDSAKIFERIAATDSLNTLAERDLAQALKSIGLMQIKLKLPAEAKKNLVRAKEILNRLQATDSLGKFDRHLIDEVDKGLEQRD